MMGHAQFKTRKQIGRDLGIGETRIGQHNQAIKKKLGVHELHEAISAFIVARSLTNQPVYREKHLQRGNLIIDSIVSDQPIENVFNLLNSSEFKQVMHDLQAGGPKAWTAKYGPWWKFGAGIALAVFLMAFLLLAIRLGPALDNLFVSMSS